MKRMWEGKASAQGILFCVATTFILFCSVFAIQNWPSPWGAGSVALACLLPVAVTVLPEARQWLRHRQVPTLWLLIFLVTALAGINIAMSSAPGVSAKAMILFLGSGVWILGVASVLFQNVTHRTLFKILCAGCLAIFSIKGMGDFWTRPYQMAPVNFFSNNPIPGTSLLILLGFGPLMLLENATSRRERWFLYLVITLAIVIIVLSTRRGTYAALLGMVAVFGMLRIRRFWIYCVAFAIALGAGVIYQDELPRWYKRELSRFHSVYERLEFYAVGAELIRKHPVFGIGFGAPVAPHVTSEYVARFDPRENPPFWKRFQKINTLDNMGLCLLAEGGLLFFLAYASLILFLLRHVLKKIPRHSLAFAVFVTVGSGFLIHSMTFDSLKFPHLNWLFHSCLGYMMHDYDSEPEST